MKAARYLSKLLAENGGKIGVSVGSSRKKFEVFGQKAREMYDAVVHYLLRKKATPVPRSDTAVALLRVLGQNLRGAKFSAPLLHTAAALFVNDGRHDRHGPYEDMLRYQLAGRIINNLPPRPNRQQEGRVYDAATELIQRERIRLADGTDAAYIFSSIHPEPSVMYKLFEVHRNGEELRDLRGRFDAILADIHFSQFVSRKDVEHAHDIARHLIRLKEPTAAATLAEVMSTHARLFPAEDGVEDSMITLLDDVRTHLDFWRRPLLLGDIEDTFLWAPHHYALPYHAADDADKFVARLEEKKDVAASTRWLEERLAKHIEEYAGELGRQGEAYPHIKALASILKLIYHSTFNEPNNHVALHVAQTLVAHPRVREELEDLFVTDPIRAQGFVEAMKRVRFSTYDLDDLSPEVAKHAHSLASNARMILDRVSGVDPVFPHETHAPVGRLNELRRVRG